MIWPWKISSKVVFDVVDIDNRCVNYKCKQRPTIILQSLHIIHRIPITCVLRRRITRSIHRIQQKVLRTSICQHQLQHRTHVMIRMHRLIIRILCLIQVRLNRRTSTLSNSSWFHNFIFVSLWLSFVLSNKKMFVFFWYSFVLKEKMSVNDKLNRFEKRQFVSSVKMLLSCRLTSIEQTYRETNNLPIGCYDTLTRNSIWIRKTIITVGGLVWED